MSCLNWYWLYELEVIICIDDKVFLLGLMILVSFRLILLSVIVFIFILFNLFDCTYCQILPLHFIFSQAISKIFGIVIRWTNPWIFRNFLIMLLKNLFHQKAFGILEIISILFESIKNFEFWIKAFDIYYSL
jgi:hypothetical protein